MMLDMMSKNKGVNKANSYTVIRQGTIILTMTFSLKNNPVKYFSPILRYLSRQFIIPLFKRRFFHLKGTNMLLRFTKTGCYSICMSTMNNCQ